MHGEDWGSQFSVLWLYWQLRNKLNTYTDKNKNREKEEQMVWKMYCPLALAMA